MYAIFVVDVEVKERLKGKNRIKKQKRTKQTKMAYTYIIYVYAIFVVDVEFKERLKGKNRIETAEIKYNTQGRMATASTLKKKKSVNIRIQRAKVYYKGQDAVELE